MAAIARKDAAAFEALFDRYSRLVFGVALRMLGQRGAAEDTTQAVFLKVWHAPELFRGGNLPAWLVRVTRNRCLDQIRARRETSPVEDARQMVDETSAEDRAFAEIDGERVRRALANLSREQREVIEMGFFGGLTHQQIAEHTGTPLGTVKTRIRSGLHRLRALLEGTVSA